MNVYLDNSATTKPRPEVTERIRTVMDESYGNPSALHDGGMAAEKILRESRSQLAAALQTRAEDGEIVFTSGGTESDNMALLCGARARKRQGRRIISSGIEHPAVLESCKALAAEGFEVVFAAVDGNGAVCPASVEAAMNEETVLISCMHVNNETGAIQPVAEICRIKEDFERRMGKRVLLHVDAVQSFGKLPPLHGGERREQIDLLSLSAHKIHGPKGTGALFIKKGCHMQPLFYGGGQERGLRPGTENVPGIAGFGLAAALAAGGIRERMERVGACKKHLLDGLRAEVKDIRVNGAEQAPDSSPYILNVSFLGVRGEVLLHGLELRGIWVSTGSACTSRKKGSSHVLSAMGRSEAEAEGAIRFSFSEYNTAEEMEYTAAAVKDAVLKFRRLGRFR
ncbi:MAG: cysteine desulfurase [Clostridiales Family XIII bacterium]|jgi:cysteine desulfurase|nr:cysteine desulfurase [Clostridiales Family XIII bacterium]